MLNALGRFNSAESGITCKFLMRGAKDMLAIEEVRAYDIFCQINKRC